MRPHVKMKIQKGILMIQKLLSALLLLPLLATAAPFHTKEQIAKISPSVVKIYTTSVQPDYARPWQKRPSRSSSGTGVVIEGNRILTAAHVVDHGTFIQVKKSNDAKKYIATVRWIAHEADLALLEVKEAAFFKDIQPHPFGTLPHRQDGVVVYGYPMGGDELSTTKGIVSRIELQTYAHSHMDHLSIQIDAPINPGNSGGPAFDRAGNIVGIAIQTLSKADGIGYLVPTKVIRHFLDDIQDGHYDGYAEDGIYVQRMQNPTIKSYYHMGNQEGILVIGVRRHSAADGFIRRGDIILEIDGVNIAGDGTISFNENSRISADYLIDSHQIGDVISMKIWRDRHEMMVRFPLKKTRDIVPYEFDKEPRFYLFGGMVFQPMTFNYLLCWGSVKKIPFDFSYYAYRSQFPKTDKAIEEYVVLDKLLPNSENANYTVDRKVVDKVNGKKVVSFDDFVKQIEQSREQYIVIVMSNGRRYVLDRAKAMKEDNETMKRYGIERRKRL